MNKTGAVIWFTGLSGAGKTTLSQAISSKLIQESLRVEALDGDQVRENLSKGLGFSKEDRDANVRRIGFVARLLARNGVVVLASAISPYRQSRDDVKSLVEEDGVRFVEVFVTCPMDVLVERDVKGLYKKALAGEIKNFTGVSDPYEDPLSPDIVVDSSKEQVERSVQRLLSFLRKNGILDSDLGESQAHAATVTEAIRPEGY
ncbi:MAG TPA: adenylyl-sulfate kinase [Blastocatellia bacterium]|nr:adenylyl-sulfate kinase [Blastocatellia bacterium]